MKRLSLFIYFFLITVLQAAAQQSFDKTAVKSVMKRVADWQIANPNKGAEHDDLDWTHAALYMGMLDWAELTEKEDSDDSYYQWLLRIGQRNHFQIGKWMYHADFIAVGQPFIDLYLKYGNKKMIAPVMARANWVVENPAETTFGTGLRQTRNSGPMVLVRRIVYGSPRICQTICVDQGQKVSGFPEQGIQGHL